MFNNSNYRNEGMHLYSFWANISSTSLGYVGIDSIGFFELLAYNFPVDRRLQAETLLLQMNPEIVG